MAAQLTRVLRPPGRRARARRAGARRSPASGRARSAPRARGSWRWRWSTAPSRRSRRADRLLADVAAGPATPYAQGIAHIAAQVARFVYWADQDAPATDPSGRWPVPPADGGRSQPADAVFHPLFEGGRRLLEGHAAAAIPPLREAVAQQRSGEGLLRSEAVALLVVALAATGQRRRRRGLLAESPPDRVAIYPGLRPWAESAVAAADGRPAAVALAFDAYGEARAAGSPISAVAYLAAAARYGAAARADAELDRVGASLRVADQRGPRRRHRGAGVGRRQGPARGRRAARRARRGGRRRRAGRAGGRRVRDRPRRRPRARRTALADEMRRRLRQAETAPGPVIPLTRRELEVATPRRRAA